MPVPLYLDTDLGDDVDDIFALLLAALHPEVSLLGVTTVFGDTPQRARIARKLLDLAGRSGVPIAAGQQQTLSGRHPGMVMASGRGFVGPEGSEEWDVLGRKLEPVDGVEFLIERIRLAPEPPVLAAIGPLTNVGAALRRAPDLAQKVRCLVLMGGRLDTEAQRGEHNFSSDAEATGIVLACPARRLIGTWDVTRLATLGDADLPRLRAGTAACRAAADQLELYLREFRRRNETSMYDPLSLTLAYTDRYLTTRPMALRWHIPEPPAAGGAGATGQDQPAPRAFLAAEDGATPNAEVSTDLDAAAFHEHLLRTIGAQPPSPPSSATHS